MKFLKSIFSGLWKVLKAAQSLAGTLLFIFVLFFLGSAIFGEDRPNVPDGGALVINPAGVIVEQLTARDSLASALGQDNQPPETLLRDVVSAIRSAKNDKHIGALVLSLDGMWSAGASQLHYIGSVIDDFKESGKPVVAYGNGYSQSQYLLATHADEIYMHPFGMALVTGYGIYPTYFKAGLEKLKADFHVFRIGDYKSFGEPYLRDDMSPEARERYSAVLGVMWTAYIEEVARERKLDPVAYRASFDNFAGDLRAAGGDFAVMAEQGGLIDGLKTWKEWREHMVGIVGANGGESQYKRISLENYISAIGSTGGDGDGRIAIVVARGTILDGEQPAGAVGGDTIARLIRKARSEKNVKGIVLRIDSGGGSAYASEVIRREVEAAQAEGIPVVASMGAVAASGGYWIASTADEIWAAPTTVTGSIGIIAIFPAFDRTLDAIGVHTDGVGTTPLSGALNPAMPMSDLVSDIVKQSLGSGYDKFLTLVAEGRGMTKEEVDAIGRGRVWTGVTAKDLGLVDNLGSLDDAVAATAKLAELEPGNYNTVYVEDPPTTEQRIIDFLFAPLAADNFTVESKQSPVRRMIRDLETQIGELLALNDPQNVYALCLECRTE